MAVMDIRIFSNTLNRNVCFKAIIPNDISESKKKDFSKNYNRPMKTLYLLHGYEGDSSDWLYKTNIYDLAEEYNLAVILPSGENSWYIDNECRNFKFKQFIGEELINYVQATFSLSSKKEDNFIGGLSMGGYGAITIGLTYPDRFSKIVGLSSALIINDLTSSSPSRDVEEIKEFTYVFGDLTQLKNSDKNPERLIKEALSSKVNIPKIFMCCGIDDFLLEVNREFVGFLSKNHVDFIYNEDEGIHDWKFWTNWIAPSIKWLLDN
ncbi:MAG: acetylesterase [Spirochaetaceae bacterium]|nr:acetylesterase [Spirochaetaceae bacterium]